jgi:hypothetical protein
MLGGKVSEAPGFHQGRHFAEWVDEVSDLRRSERLDEALTLLSHLMDATEAEAATNRWGVAPWYYEQAAMIYRNLGDKAAEVEVLERFERQPKAHGAKPAKLAERLNRLRG